MSSSRVNATRIMPSVQNHESYESGMGTTYDLHYDGGDNNMVSMVSDLQGSMTKHAKKNS